MVASVSVGCVGMRWLRPFLMALVVCSFLLYQSIMLGSGQGQRRRSKREASILMEKEAEVALVDSNHSSQKLRTNISHSSNVKGSNTENKEELFPILDQDDPMLVSYVLANLLHPPAPISQSYFLKEPKRTHFSQHDQSDYANKEFLHNMTGGFFVEVGALDGERFSNSLFFERELGWSGLLIEANPSFFKILSRRGRKAYTVNVGLSPIKKSATYKFELNDAESVINTESESAVPIQAVPLYTLLLALNITLIDFFSLDIEGYELEVLKTIPWEKVRVRLLCVEINNVPDGTAAVVTFMEKQDYILLGIRSIDAWFGKKELLEESLNIKLSKSYVWYSEER